MPEPEEAVNALTGLAVDLDVRELSYLLSLLTPQVVHPMGADSYLVEMFIKLNTAFRQLTQGETTMPDTGGSYDKGQHVPDRASGNMTKKAGGHAEPATKKPLREKTVQQVMGETPHMPAPRDTERAVKKGNGGGMKTNAGS